MALRGFTLIEMLVALAIFAVLGVISATLMSRILAGQEVLDARSTRLAEVQRAMHVLKRDLMQVTKRPIRDILGEPLHSVLIDSDGLIEFSRLGWRNPLQIRRAEVQRVAYRLHEGDLQRVYWNVLDRTQDTEPVVQQLLADVTQVEFFALGVNGEEHHFWPLRDNAPESQEWRLAAVIMRLECEPFGVVERIWLVAGA